MLNGIRKLTLTTRITCIAFLTHTHSHAHHIFSRRVTQRETIQFLRPAATMTVFRNYHNLVQKTRETFDAGKDASSSSKCLDNPSRNPDPPELLEVILAGESRPGPHLPLVSLASSPAVCSAHPYPHYAYHFSPSASLTPEVRMNTLRKA